MGEEAENTSIMEDIAAAWEEHEQESESEAHEETGKAPDGAESGEDVPLVEVAEEVEEEPSLREKSEVQENVVETSEVWRLKTRLQPGYHQRPERSGMTHPRQCEMP
jgi:hypothetical protein